MAATSAEKSTGRGGELNAVSVGGSMTGIGASAVYAGENGMGDGAAEGNKFCSIDNPECEACQ
jgi:ribonucleoside-diphosphate reductase alpha chain